MKTLAEKPGYKWVIAALCSLLVMVSVGVHFNTLSQFLKTVTEELPISRSSYSAVAVVGTATTILTNLLFGTLVSKLSERRLVLFGSFTLACATLAYSFAQDIRLLALYFFLQGCSLSFCSTTMISYVINRWFTENRGAVMGVVMAGSGIGLALGTQILRPIITGSRCIFGQTGFRAAMRLETALLALVFLLLLLFFRNAPERADAAQTTVKKQSERDGVYRRPIFWFTILAMILTATAIRSPLDSSTAHLEDLQLDQSYITNIVSLYAVSLFFSKFLVGRLYDRFGLAVALTVANAAAVLSTLCLFMTSTAAPGFALAHELLLGLAISQETVLQQFVMLDIFGEKRYAKMIGFKSAAYSVGAYLGPFITSCTFDAFGNYRPVLLGAAALLALVTVAMPLLLALGKKERTASAM